MRIRNGLGFIGSIVSVIASLLIISGCSAEKKQIRKRPIKKAAVSPTSYNLSKAPSREQWTSKKTGNLVVIFTAKDSLSNTPEVRDQSLKCQIVVDKNKQNVITKTFYADNFGAVQLIPGTYNIKNILKSATPSNKSATALSKLEIKGGETVVLWNYVTTSKDKPLISKTKILDSKSSQYTYSIVSSSNKMLRLDPRICFGIAPEKKKHETKAVRSVKELTQEKTAVLKKKEQFEARLAELEKSKEQVAKTIPGIKKSINSANTDAQKAEKAIKEEVDSLTRLGDTLEALKSDRIRIKEKIDQLKKWQEKSARSNSEKSEAIAKLKQQEANAQKSIDTAKQQVKQLEAKLQSMKKSKEELTSQQDKLVAEQTVLTNIRTDLNVDKVLSEDKIASIDKAVDAEKESKKQAVELMKTLLADDQLADDKLAGINKKIKSIYNNIKAKEAERPNALKKLRAAEKKLEDNEKKLQEVSTNALTYLKNIELARKNVEKTELALNSAELKLKDFMLDKKLVESKVAQFIELTSKNSGEKAQLENDIKKLQAEIGAIEKREEAEGNKLPALQAAVNKAKSQLQTAEREQKMSQNKLSMTEGSLRELTEVAESVKDKIEDLDLGMAYLDAKIKIAENNAQLAKENLDYRSQKRTLNMMIAELRDTKSLLEGKVKFEKMKLSKSHQELKKQESDIKTLLDKLKVAQNNTRLEQQNTAKAKEQIKVLEAEKAQNIVKATALLKTIEDAQKASKADKITLTKKEGNYKKLLSDKDELARQLDLASKKSQVDLARLENAFKKEKELTDKIKVLESQLKTTADTVKKSSDDKKFCETNLALASKLAQDLGSKVATLEKKLKESEETLATNKRDLIKARDKSASGSSEIRILTAKLNSEYKAREASKKAMQDAKAKYNGEIAVALETIKELTMKLKAAEKSSESYSTQHASIDTKLKATEAEKVRLEAQVKQLSEKAEADKRFMNDELKELKGEFENAFEQKKKHQTALKGAFDKIDALTTEKSKLEASLNETENKYNQAFDEKRKQQLLATDIKDKMKSLAAEKSALESELASAEDKLDLQRKSINQSGDMSLELKTQRDELKNTILKLREDIRNKDESITAVQKESNKQVKLNEAQAKEIAELKAQVTKTSDKLLEARVEIDKMRISQKQIEDRLRFADDKIKIEKKSNFQASELAGELKLQRDKLNKEIKRLENTLEQSQKDALSKATEADEATKLLTKKLADKEKELSYKVSKVSRLESKEKELMTEIERMKKSAAIKDRLLISFGKRLKDQREIEKIPSYRSTPAR